MSPEEFRRHGKALVDWVADYWESLDERRIVPDVAPGDIRAMLPNAAPEAGEAFADIIADLDRVVLPGLTHWQAPGWFAYFPANASFPAILGELVSAGLGQQGMLWATSPAATEIESHVLDWLADLMGVPQTWKSAGPGGGVLQMSASDSTHTALVVAAERGGQPRSRLVAYASAQAHSSVEKGARVAGYGQMRLIPTEPPTHALSAVALQTTIAQDIADGLVPAFVCASVGTTGTTAVDPVRRIAEIGRQVGAWVHVDAAYAGSAMICPEFRVHQDGLELVDSYTFNPHKWLLTNFDCSVFWVADRAPLIAALSILPPYLSDQAGARRGHDRTADERGGSKGSGAPLGKQGAAIDYRDWHVPLGRRFRALKLWFVLRTYGAEGLRAYLREHVRLAQWLAGQVAAHERLELIAPTLFGLVCFAHVDGDDATQAVADAVVASHTSYLATSVIEGRRFVRVSIGSTTTRQPHVERLWGLIRAAS